MRFSWTGLLVAPLLVPLLASIALQASSGGDSLALSFLILLLPGCVISYGTTIFLFLPCMFILSRYRPLTGLSVCLLGLVVGVAVHVPVTLLAWGLSGPDSGPPAESLFSFFLHWSADPVTAMFPVAGLVTAGAWWWLGTRRENRRAI
jgi:hypothetical protein